MPKLRNFLRKESLILPVLVGCVFLILTYALWVSLESDNAKKIEEISEIQAQNVSQHLLRSVEERLNSIERMAKRWNRQIYTNKESWFYDASVYLNDFKDIEALAWADETSLVRWVHPKPKDESIYKFKLASEAVRREAFHLAKSSGKTAITKILRIRDGSEGYSTYTPIYRDGQFDGVIVAVFKTNSFFHKFIYSSEYQVSLFEDGKRFYLSSGLEGAPKFARSVPLEIRTVRWSVMVAPYESTIKKSSSWLSLVALWVGVVVSFLFSTLTYLVLRTREGVRLLKKSDEWAKAVMDGSDLMIVSTTQDYKIKTHNKAVERILGYNAVDIVGKLDFSVWHDSKEVVNASKRLSEEVQATILPGVETLTYRAKHRIPEKNEWTFISRSGERIPVLLSVHAIGGVGNSVEGYVCIAEDLRKKKQQENKIRQQESQMIQSAKMASLGEMAGGIAHEINNPLAIISGKAGRISLLYQTNKATPDLVIREVKDISETVQRIAKIISGLRSFARDSGNDPMVDVSLKKLLEETVSFCSERFKHHRVDLSIGELDDSVIIYCRPAQISQVLLNLLNNSFDSTMQVKERFVKIVVVSTGDYIRISVIDSGRGVPESIRMKIMQPFFTTKEVGKGTGLGLSTSQGIVSEHGGMLYLDEAAAQTTFVVVLPRTKTSRKIA